MSEKGIGRAVVIIKNHITPAASKVQLIRFDITDYSGHAITAKTQVRNILWEWNAGEYYWASVGTQAWTADSGRKEGTIEAIVGF